MSESTKLQPLQQQHPLSSRQTVQTLQNETGTIVKLDPVNFGIQSGQSGQPFLPFNLPQEFQQEGLRVCFSGNVKQIGLNELMAGNPLELTAIKRQ